MAGSVATVKVYTEAGLTRTFTAPVAGDGDYWLVADIDGVTQEVTLTNQIQSIAPTRLAPGANANPRRKLDLLDYLWTFGDGTSSTLENPLHTYTNAGLYTVSLTLVDSNNVPHTETKTNFIQVTGPTNHVLTVDVNSASRSYGAANPAFTGKIIGLQAGDNITVTYTNATTPASMVGTYVIVPVFNDPNHALSNYTVITNSGTLAITNAPLTVTANNAARAVGAPNPMLNGTIMGLQNGDAIAATYITAATPASPAGTYLIAPMLVDPGHKLGNYNVSLVNGTLTVGKALPVITWANPAAIVYGTPLSSVQLNPQANVPGSFSYNHPPRTVLKAGNGQTLSVTFTPTDAADYTTASASVTIDVQPAPLTIAANDRGKNYGQADRLFRDRICRPLPDFWRHGRKRDAGQPWRGGNRHRGRFTFCHYSQRSPRNWFG